MESIRYRTIRSSRKTVSIQIQTDGEVVVRCPRQMTAEAVHHFVERKAGWIQRHLQKQRSRPQDPPFTKEEIAAFTRCAKSIIPNRVDSYAKLLGVDYGRITIRAQHTRWGSCSGKGNLNFNCLLALVPPEVLDYIVVHELCHRKHMDHSVQFWNTVEQMMPQYRLQKAWLKEFGPALIGRLPKS